MVVDALPPRTDIGAPDFRSFLPEVVKRNYGRWKLLVQQRPGVLVHEALSGERLYAVRAASPRLLAVETVRWFAELAERYCEGHLRFTPEHQVEFLLPDATQIEPLMSELNSHGYPVGGTGMHLAQPVHSDGWVGSAWAATDAPALSKVLMQGLWEYYAERPLPAKFRLAVACSVMSYRLAQGADLVVLGVHRSVPQIDFRRVHAVSEIPTLLGACPTAALRPASVDGYPSVQLLEGRCVRCGHCATVCSAIRMPEGHLDGVSIWVGGKLSSDRTEPRLGKLAVPYLVNRPPHWTDVVQSVRGLVQLWAEEARPQEAMGDWIERIGWTQFFRRAGLCFTPEHLEGSRPGSYRSSAQWRPER